MKDKTIICIGRQYGSGGREIGEKTADILSMSYYDKLLVKESALQSGYTESMIESTEEQPICIESLLAGNVFADTVNMMNNFYSGSLNTYQAERKIIEEIGQKGNAVIVGRCASSIIPREKTISVFIYADMPDRIARVMKRNNINEHEAKERIKHIDRMRKQFFDFYSDTAWGKTESYDIMISSTSIGTQGCTDLIVAAYNNFNRGVTIE